jgi:hypothetical protein
LRTAISTCLKNGCVRRLIRAPLRDRPGLTRKFSLSSLAMTRRLTWETARTRAAEHRSRQIASTRMMANKQRSLSSTHIAGAIAWKIEIKKRNSEGGTCTPCAVLSRRHREVQKPMCRQTLATAGRADRRSALSGRQSEFPSPPSIFSRPCLQPPENCKSKSAERQKFIKRAPPIF